MSKEIELLKTEHQERIIALLVAFMPFETTIKTVTENIGAKMETVFRADIETSQQTHLSEPKADVLAVLVDGTMMNIRDEQWKEVKVGAVEMDPIGSGTLQTNCSLVPYRYVSTSNNEVHPFRSRV